MYKLKLKLYIHVKVLWFNKQMYTNLKYTYLVDIKAIHFCRDIINVGSLYTGYLQCNYCE